MTQVPASRRHVRHGAEGIGVIGAIVRIARSLRSDRRGSAAIEFAIVSGALITTILFIMSVGLVLYIGQALDRATSVAGRQIMTGSVQKQALSQSAFITNVVCPALPALFNCANVIVNVQTFAEGQQPNGYYQFVNSNQTALIIPTLSNASTQFSLGTQGNYVYLQVIYPVTIIPSFVLKILGTTPYNGSSAYLSISTLAFRNEQY